MADQAGRRRTYCSGRLFGPMPSCCNMCAFLERSGLRVFCGGQFGKALETLCVMPQAIVIRVDGAAESGNQAREEFRALTEFEDRAARSTPLACVTERGLNVGPRLNTQEAGLRVTEFT